MIAGGRNPRLDLAGTGLADFRGSTKYAAPAAWAFPEIRQTAAATTRTEAALPKPETTPLLQFLALPTNQYRRLASNYQSKGLLVPLVYKSIFCGYQILFIPGLLTQRGGIVAIKLYSDSTCQRGECPMRDFMFMLAPVALIFYFVVYPEKFSSFLGWAGQFLH